MKQRKLTTLVSLTVLLAASVQACSDGQESSGEGDGDGDSGDSSSATSGDGDGDGSTGKDSTSGGLDVTGGTDTSGDNTGGEGGGGPVCETASSEAEIPPVYLAFAFDVSGSMGHLDQPNWWHDPDAKWIPVVEATRAFFEDDTSHGISASMALFPAKDDKCDSDTYTDPEVEMTKLPSLSFAGAFEDYEDEVGSPLAGGDWRGSTPTAAAIHGVGESLSDLRKEQPDAKFAIVLVTDGLPQGCDGSSLSDASEAAADFFADGLSTYVIGIENPTTPPDDVPAAWDDWGNCDSGSGGGDEPCTPPDTLAPLNELADAGGTQSAFLIDTGNPSATKQAFSAAIEAIRQSSLSCSLAIPEHPEPGMMFEKDKIDVSVTIDGKTTRFNYDAECAELGSWHYDDASDPTKIEICEATCLDLKKKPEAELNVDFLCEPRPDVIR